MLMDLLADLESAVRAGNAALALAIVLSRRARELPPGDRGELLLRAVETLPRLKARGGTIAPALRLRFVDRLASTTPSPVDEGERRRLQALIADETWSVVRSGAPGVLFAATGALRLAPDPEFGVTVGVRFGVAQPMTVSVRPYGSGTLVEHAAKSDGVVRRDMNEAFATAVSVACHRVLSEAHRLNLIAAHGIYVWQRMEAQTVVGRFEEFETPIGGRSIGLAAAVAAVFAMLELPFPAGVALTGRVDERGAVHEVAGIPQKLHAAAAAGLTLVLCPTNDAAAPRDLVAPAGDLTVTTVTNVSEAIQVLLAHADLRDAFDDAVRAFSQRQLAQRPLVLPIPDAMGSRVDAPRRLMVGFASTSDPWPTWRHGDEDTAVDIDEEGPFLTIARFFRPTEVMIFCVEDTSLHLRAKAGPTTHQRAEGLAQILSHELNAVCTVRPFDSHDVKNPEDLRGILTALHGELANVLANPTEDTQIAINLSSGSPSMTASLMLLKDRYRCRHATLYKACRSSEVAAWGGQRVRVEELPLLL